MAARRVPRLTVALLPALLVLATHACREPTEMTMRITTEVPCSALRGVSIVVAADALAAEERARTKYFAAETTHCDSESVVGSLVLTPGSDALAVIVVAGIDQPSSACVPPAYLGCVVARRRLAFVDHASLDVPIILTRDCLDVPCDTQTSCVHGNCKSSETACDGDACTQTAGGGDAGPGTDARLDTGSDSTLVEDVGADARSDAYADAADAADGGYHGGGYVCSSSPSCIGQPIPCTCAGSITLKSDGRMTKMDMSCPAGGGPCTCSIEGTFVKSVPNPTSCQSGTYGSGCCSP